MRVTLRAAAALGPRGQPFRRRALLLLMGAVNSERRRVSLTFLAAFQRASGTKFKQIRGAFKKRT